MKDFVSTNSFSIEDIVSSEKLVEFKIGDDKAPGVNTEINTFNDGDLIQFTPKSKLYNKIVNGNKAACCIVEVNGVTKLLYHGSMGRVVPEYKHSEIIGEKAKPTGITYAANHKDFKVDAPKTQFYKCLTSFAGIKAAYEAFAKYNVKIEVVDSVRVETLRFGEEVRTRMQKLLCFEFAKSYTDEELTELYRNLDNEARISFGKQPFDSESEVVNDAEKKETEEKAETKTNA